MYTEINMLFIVIFAKLPALYPADETCIIIILESYKNLSWFYNFEPVFYNAYRIILFVYFAKVAEF